MEWFFYKNAVEKTACFEIHVPVPSSVEIAAELNIDDFIQMLQQ